MKKVLFSHSYFLRFDPKQWKIKKPYAPLGTLYAASLLRENNFDVALHDTMFAKSPDELLFSIKKHLPDYFIIYDDGFNYLTKMCLTNMRKAAFKMIEIAKQNNCIVIVSSSDATDHFQKYLAAGADFIIVGEGEITVLELLQSLSNNQSNLSAINGLVYKNHDGIIKTLKRNVLKELDSLPLPAWDLVDLTPYKKAWLKSSGYFSINMVTTRGCPYKCNWCAKPIYGNRYNVRSPQNVLEEIKLLQKMTPFEHIWFCDDIFGLKPGWVEAFAELIQKENIQIRFKIQSRADLLVQKNYVQALARAGCENVWMGAESGSQKILDAMDKGTTTAQIADATKLLRKHFIKASFFIQFGYLGEERQDIESTIKMINELLPDEIGISVSYPLPGTKFYDKVKEQLQLKANWTDSDDLALLFYNTYTPSFYRHLHRYVHINYRKHLALANALRFIKKPLQINIPVLKKILSGVYYAPAAYFQKRKLMHLQNE